MNSSANPGEKSRIFCNYCKRDTNHIFVAGHMQVIEEEESEHSPWHREETAYALWACAGCDTGVLVETTTIEGMVDEKGDLILMTEFSPKRKTHDIREKIFFKLPSKLRTIYRETIRAFNAELYILTAAGLRALIEGICENKRVPKGNLEARINGLAAHLPANIVDNLHGFRFMGNEAVHELAKPDRNDLRHAIDVSEDLLNFLYELDYKASRLAKHKKQLKTSNG